MSVCAVSHHGPCLPAEPRPRSRHITEGIGSADGCGARRTEAPQPAHHRGNWPADGCGDVCQSYSTGRWPAERDANQPIRAIRPSQEPHICRVAISNRHVRLA